VTRKQALTTGAPRQDAPFGGKPGDRAPHAARSALVILAVAHAGCGFSTEATARWTFAWNHSCPEDRVAVDTKVYYPPHEEAPPDVRADPERLSMWDESHARLERPRPYYVVAGCGLVQTYYCKPVYGRRWESLRCYPASDARTAPPTSERQE